MSINRHLYLVTSHASYWKTQHQSPMQYNADVSVEERENHTEQINKKREIWDSVQDFRISMYKKHHWKTCLA